MAIRRCPYCKAIIDEQDKYCNNCGTQLLFPEDEFVEEEIPGDKIVDEEEPEAETKGEDTGEEEELGGELEQEEEFLEGEGRGEEEEKEEDELEGKRQVFDDSVREAPEKDSRETGELTGSAEEEIGEAGEGSSEEAGLEEDEEAPGAPDKEREEEEAEEEEEEVSGRPEESAAEVSGEAELEPAEIEGREEASDKKYEVSIENDELVFRTKDMARLTGMTDEGKPRTERAPDTGTLPPWVDQIRETPATVEPEEETRAEPQPLSREWTTDSGIGIPERITQVPLPLGDDEERRRKTPARENFHMEEETGAVTTEAEESGRPGPLSSKLRSRVVDWVFVTALWAISLWFTAQVVGVPFFRLIFGSPLPVLAFYVILLVLYFFLFLYFLGETLGDHYFSE